MSLRQIKARAAATVEVVQARGRREQLTGKITFVSPLLEADGTYRVWADDENRPAGRSWVLRPGAKVEMTIDSVGDGDVDASPSRSASGRP